MCLFLSCLAATAQADWTILSTTSEPGRDGLLHRHVVLENDAGGGRATVDLAIFSKSAHCVSFKMKWCRQSWRDDEHEKCLAGVNGGYFDENFAPLGLRIANGQMIAPLQRARLITGCLSPHREEYKSCALVNFRGASE